MFFILFFLVSVNAYVFNEQFKKVNCDYYLSEEREVYVFKWQFPDKPKCVPWDLSQCESYVKYETSCIKFSCSISFSIFLYIFYLYIFNEITDNDII